MRHALARAPGHREWRAYYRAWLTLRRHHPALGAMGKRRTRVEMVHDMLMLARQAATGERVMLIANLSAIAQPLPPVAPAARVLLDSADPRYGGSGGEPLRPYQALLFELAAAQ
jgi:Domain of unknown function (DUF3459)